MFPFARFPGVDLILGPEMKSTGEVMGLDTDFGRAFAKSQLGSGTNLPLRGPRLRLGARSRQERRSSSRAASSSRWASRWLPPTALPQPWPPRAFRFARVNKVSEGRPHIVDLMLSGGIQLVFNTTEGAQAIADSFSLRRTALTNSIPYYTTVAGARAAVQAIGALRAGSLEVAPLQSYF